MASLCSQLSVLLVLATALAYLRGSEAVIDPATELSFNPKLVDANSTRQWTLSLSVKRDGQSEFVPFKCEDPQVNACIEQNPPLQQGRNDVLRVTYNFRAARGPGGALATWQQQVPTQYKFKICYTPESSVNRAWRTKNKPYPRVSQNCPHEFGMRAFDPVLAQNNGTADLDFLELDEVPTATWFAMMWVYCGEAVCAFETTEKAPANRPANPAQNYFQTEVEMGITPGMRASAIILSIFGPVFFIVYWIADHLKYQKTGRALTALKPM